MGGPFGRLTLLAPTGIKIHGEKAVPWHPQLAVDQEGAPRNAWSLKYRQRLVDPGKTKKPGQVLGAGRVAQVTHAITPTPADVRTAADTLKAAIDAHLEACEHGTGEHDPEVQAAYDALHRAAKAYDDLVSAMYDEVLPWHFAGPPSSEMQADVGELHTFTVLARHDYRIDDLEALLSVGRKAYAQAWPHARVEYAYTNVTTAGTAIYQMLHTYGFDGLTERHQGAGLYAYGGTVWVQPLRPKDASLDSENPFKVVDPDVLVYRLDEVYED
jgi:hypothetical protein